MVEYEIYQKLATHALDLCDKVSTPQAKDVATRLSKKWAKKAEGAKVAVAIPHNPSAAAMTTPESDSARDAGATPDGLPS